MANPEHLEWLKEGVDVWNKRRLATPFRPDFEYADLQRADLQRADLQRADLQRADLQAADLRQADLRQADLRAADLRQAELLRADLRGADLQAADLRQADLQAADVRSLKSTLRTKNTGKADFTLAQNLTQDQLETMIGDTGVLLPEGLVHPEHWPEWVEEDEAAEEEYVEPTTNGGGDPEANKRLKSVIRSSPITVRINDGRYETIDGPPGGEPAAVNEPDKNNLYSGIETGCELFLKRFKARQPNIPADVAEPFETARQFAEERCVDWYRWDHILSSMNGDLDQFEGTGWAGTRGNAEKITEQIQALAKYLKLELQPEDETAEKDGSPGSEVGEYSPEVTEELIKTAQSITTISGAETVMTNSTINFFNGVAMEVSKLNRDIEVTPPGKLSEKRKGRWRKAVYGLAGAVAAMIEPFTVGVAAGVTTHVITTKEAWPALLQRAYDLWEVISKLLVFAP